MEALTKLNDEAQSIIAERFDKEFATLTNFIQRAYVQGLNDGKESAKSEIIGMIKGEWK